MANPDLKDSLVKKVNRSDSSFFSSFILFWKVTRSF